MEQQHQAQAASSASAAPPSPSPSSSASSSSSSSSAVALPPHQRRRLNTPPSPSSSPPASPLAHLHPELQRLVGSFLSASDAVRGVGLASRDCHRQFLAGVVRLDLTPKPLQLEPQKSEAEHAAMLARLLRRLPALSAVKCHCLRTPAGRSDFSQDGPMVWVLGLACRRLGSPLGRVAKLGLPSLYSYQWQEAHPLALGLAEGRFPALQELNMGSSWTFLSEPANAPLLEQVLREGHLSQLQHIYITVGGLQALCHGFVHAPAPIQQRQVHVKSLSIYGYSEAAPETLRAMLRLPCFSRLETITFDTYHGELSSMLDVFAHYLTHADGHAPSLRDITIMPPEDSQDGLGPLVHALGAGGGAPNLERLYLIDLGPDVMENIGAIYAAGGLSKLETLSLDNPGRTEASIDALIAGAAASQHRGVALFSFSIDVYRFADAEEREAAVRVCEYWKRQMEGAKQRGVFPNAHCRFGCC